MLQKVHRAQDDTGTSLQGIRSEGWKQDDTGTYNDGLLGTGFPIMAGAYGAAFGIAALTFLGSGDALFAIAICSVYDVMFFGIPLLISKVRNAHDLAGSRIRRSGRPIAWSHSPAPCAATRHCCRW